MSGALSGFRSEIPLQAAKLFFARVMGFAPRHALGRLDRYSITASAQIRFLDRVNIYDGRRGIELEGSDGMGKIPIASRRCVMVRRSVFPGAWPIR